MAGAVEVFRGVDAERGGFDVGGDDAHAGFQGAELFEFFAAFEGRFRERDEAGEGGAAVGVDADSGARGGRGRRGWRCGRNRARGATAAFGGEGAGGFDHGGAGGSAAVSIGATRVAMSASEAMRAWRTVWMSAGSMVGRSPCRLMMAS